MLCTRDLSDRQGMKLVNGITSKETLCSPDLPFYFLALSFSSYLSKAQGIKFTFSLHFILKKERREGVGRESNRDKRNKEL